MAMCCCGMQTEQFDDVNNLTMWTLQTKRCGHCRQSVFNAFQIFAVVLDNTGEFSVYHLWVSVYHQLGWLGPGLVGVVT
jgi:hypothetical protein